MKNHNSKLIFIIICFALLAMAAPVQAEETKTIHIKVAAFDNILFNDDFTVNACPDSDNASSTNLTINAFCAITQLASSSQWTSTSTWYSFGVMLNSINQYDGSDGNYWLWFSNSEIGDTALNQHLLTDGENLLLTYGTGPLKIFTSSTTPAINSTSTISASYFDTNAWQWQPAASSTFVVNGQEIASTTDAYQLWTSTTTPYVVTAKKAGFLDSDSITITPQLPTINIKLRVETASSTLFNDNFTVNACPDNATSTNFTVNAWCATDQLISSQSWSATSTWYSFGVMLNSINQYDGSDGNYWLWFSNSEIGDTALNQHLLTDGENLLLTYGTGPLKIFTSSTTPAINSTSTISASYFDTNAWQWQPAASSTFVVNGQEVFSADGTFQLFISTSSPYSILGRKTGYLDSPILILNGVLQDSTSTEPVNPPPPNPGPGSADVHQSVNIGSAVNFLISHQNDNGSVGSSVLYSDWTAMAFAAYGDSEAKNKLKNYLLTDPSPTAGMNAVSDYTRRAMALMALGINPYNGTKTDYIAAIVAAFDGNQIGDPSIFNDDIFALFPLLKAGYSGSDPIISTTIKFIISKQNANGSWDSVDLTAAAIQALMLAQKTGNLSGDLGDVISQSLLAAKNFLRNSQGVNGGFNNNSFSTSWVIQAIAALGESVSSWENSSKYPTDFLASYQKNDGGFENESTAADTRIWATTYAIPAALNKTWSDILNDFPKLTPLISVINNSSGESNATSTPEAITATSTPIVENATSTATSTPAIENTTSTLISALPEETIAASGSVTQNPPQNNNINPATISPLTIEQKNPEITQTPPPLEAQIVTPLISANLVVQNTARIIFYLSTTIVISLGLFLVLKFFFVL